MLGETEKAQSLAKKALEEAHASELVWLQARAQSLIGQALMTIGQPITAETYFHQALSTFLNAGMLLEHARTVQEYNACLLECLKIPSVASKL